ncbi:MAG TPA: hypothetical protein EYH05_17995, partial [Anaerolineae bacterium]|nr:hypothetical protein [Anaerolineae bacterium]
MSNIRISGSPETPDDSDQIVVLSEQSNHPPIRERPFAFPEGHRKWGRPEDGAVQVSLGPKAYRVVTEHALGDSRREVGGLLLGRVFQGERPGIFHVAVDEALPDRRGVGRSATFAFTHESWGILCDEAKARFPNYRIVGWYHSHPNYGIFYSSVDQHSHQTYFDKPWLVGLVVDPKRNQGGFFSASSHGVDQLPGFYERVEDEGWFVQWNNSERTAISSHHPSQAAIVTRDRPSSRNHSESQREERQTFSKRFSEDIPLSLAFIFFVAFVLSLFALLFSVYN